MADSETDSAVTAAVCAAHSVAAADDSQIMQRQTTPQTVSASATECLKPPNHQTTCNNSHLNSDIGRQPSNPRKQQLLPHEQLGLLWQQRAANLIKLIMDPIIPLSQ
jgi:hypothetical protein